MKDRKRIKPEVLACEKKDILHFVQDRIERKLGRLHMSEIFSAYRSWRRTKQMGNSRLSIDGFGRLFPAGFSRDKFLFNGKIAKGVKGVVIRESQ